ncbi:MAG: T9SS type A sorting domain-containing protein [Ignavibacteriae bacterium]|nr:T9SS type A sorting domain-containing protein [Ignavibacteriota bacterium]
MKNLFYVFMFTCYCIPSISLFSQIEYFPNDLVLENDTLWLTCGRTSSGSQGLVKFNTNNENFEIVNGDYPKNTGNIIIDNDANKWIGTNEGLMKFKGKNWEIYNIENSNLPGNYFQESQFVVNNNDIWITSNRGFTLIQDTSYLGSTLNGLIKFDGKKFTFFNMENSGLPSNRIYSIAKDSLGNIWIGTNNGIVSYDGNDWTVYNINNSPLLYNSSGAIGVDNYGIIWIGQGNAVISFDGSNFTTYKIDEPTNFSYGIDKIVFDSKNCLWAACDDGVGLLKFDGIKWTIYNKDNSNYNFDVLHSICVGKNDILWLGGFTLFKFDGTDFTTLPEFDISKGLIANYSFVKCGMDISGNELDGTLFGGITWVNDRAGGYYSAVKFNGIDSRIEVPHNEDFNLSENDTLSISLWFTISNKSGGLLFKGNNITNYGITNNSDGKISANISSNSSNNWISATSTKSLTFTYWHHLVAIYTQTKIMLYVDGQFDNQITFPKTPIINSDPLFFGVEASGKAEYFNGKLDDIRIYKRYLNPNDVFALFNERSNESISIISPKDGDKIIIGSIPTIKFIPLTNKGNINIDYSIDEGANWINIVENIPNIGKYESWYVPNTPSYNCKIRISAPKYGQYIISDGSFSIVNMNENDGLIAYYPLNKNTKDESGNEHNGTIFGNFEWISDRFNNLNSAIHFNGIDCRIEVPHFDELNLKQNNTLSYSFWFSIDNHIQYAGFICKGDTISNYCISDNVHGRIAANLNHYSTDKTQTIITSKSIPLNEWHHLVATYTPTKILLYLDGKLDNQISITNTRMINSDPLYFGVDADGELEYLKGSLDDVRIYNRILGENEILKLYNEKISTSKNITYKIIFPNCDNSQTHLIIEEGNFSEGQTMKFPEYNIPNQYSAFQPYYNSLINAELFFPKGSLNENIKIEFMLKGMCENGLIDSPKTEEIVEVLYLSFTVIGDSSGSHNPLEYYYFNKNKEGYLKIPRSNIDSLMELLNYNIDLLFPFFAENGLEPDFEGIRKVVDENYYTIYFKHLSEIKLGVISSPTSIKNITNSIPTEYKLDQNYPNPFNPTTKITYQLPEKSIVTLKVYDILGKKIVELVNETREAGNHEVIFDASNLSSGIYYYQIKAGDFIQSKKMLLIK